jgi:hypothetical protein
MDYYIYKLPVYNYQGKLLVEYMFNNIYTGIESKILDIDIRFIKMLGIKNYINPKYKTLANYINMDQIVDDLNHVGLIILSYHINNNQYKKRYNLSVKLQNKINNLDNISDIEIPKIDIPEHNLAERDNLTNVYFNLYKSNLSLDECGFTTEPNKIFYNYFYYKNKFDNNKRYNFLRITTSNLKKYIKYKTKYMNLKYNNKNISNI